MTVCWAWLACIMGKLAQRMRSALSCAGLVHALSKQQQGRASKV